jgi:exodeoxyribonuclease VII large subunit
LIYQQLKTLKLRCRRSSLERKLQQEAAKLNWTLQRIIQAATGKLQQASQHLEMLRQKADICSSFPQYS